MNTQFPSILKSLSTLLIIYLVVVWGLPATQNAPLTTDLYAGWEEVGGSAADGGISNLGTYSNVPSLVFDPEGRPVVAWNADNGGNPEVFLKRLEGSAWVGIGGSAAGGGISNTAGDSGRVSLAIAAGGQPVVAWREIFSDGNAEIFVKHWNGSAWVGMNGSATGDNISLTSTESSHPSLAIDHDGRPVVAWNEFTTNPEIYVKRWNGTAWEGIGGSATGGGISISPRESRDPSLAINSLDYPVVAWAETTPDGDSDIFVKGWNGSVWGEMDGSATGGGVSQNNGGSYKPSLAITKIGEIAVAWEDDSGPGDDFDIYVKRWTGLTWTGIGSHSDSAGGISDNDGPSYWVTLDVTPDGSWVIAWEDSSGGERSVYFRIWNGSSWVEQEAGSATGGGISEIMEGYRSTRPSLAVAPDGTLMVAWEQVGDSFSEIYARRYRPPTYGGWKEVSGSATGGGISNNGGVSIWPSLAFDHNGAPIVVWQDNQSGNNEIYGRKLSNLWGEIGGSATAGGVSGTPGGSARPSLAVDADGRPVVAWREATDSDTEIYLRRWNGSAWVPLGNSMSGGGLSDTIGDSDSPWLAIDHAGYPVVAWVETTTNREIYVARWNGSTWAPLGNSASNGGISDSPGDSFRPSVAVDLSGNPIVAWSDVDIGSGNSEIYAKGWNGAAWVEMGTGSASGGGVSNSPGGSFRPFLAVDSKGKTYLAWEDGSDGDYDIYIKQFDLATQSWKAVGTGSAAGGGISQNYSNSTWPALAIDPYDAPVIAWQDDVPLGSEIYLLRFSGTVWAELGPESASYSGISGAPSNMQAKQPSLAIDATGRMMVAWELATDEGESHIHARAYTLCFPLALSHTGQGQDPIAIPTNSSGCKTGEYNPGETIYLTAEPAQGWRVAGWHGTDNDSSEGMSNTLTMPANNHVTGVQYTSENAFSYVPLILK